MANNPRTPKRAWRGDRPGSARPSGGQPAWKADRGAGGGPRVSRNVKIGFVLALFLLVAAAAAAVYLWPRSPDPFRLVLVGAAYEQNLAAPSNVVGRRGLDGLEQWAADYNKKSFGPQQVKNVDVRRQTIEGLKDPVGEAVANTNAPAVVIFLTADGGGDDQGAYVLPDDAGPRNLDVVYRIDKALDALKKLKSETQKLLILDASGNGDDWSMRQLHNDFAHSVKKLDARIKEIPNLVVLCACDEGQQSWDSEEYGQSVFAHFVIEGLKGAADKEWEGENLDGCNIGDGRITALELARYAQNQVERWVRRNRGFDQKPQLLGDENVARKMELVGADADYKEPDPATLTPWSPPDELRRAWQEYEELGNSSPPPAAYTPQQWREYQAALLRYEQLLRTDDGPAAAGLMRQRVGRLHDQIVQAQRLDRDALANSLAAPAAFGWSLEPDADARLKDGFDQLWREKAKPEQYQRFLSGLLADAPNRAVRRLLRLRFTALLLDKAPLSHDDYLRVCDVLPKLADPPEPPPAEANFAAMAQASEALLPGKTVASWDRLRQALTLRRSAETAALGLGAGPPDMPAYSEQTAAWIGPAVEHADVNRRLGEDLLFASAREDQKAAKALTDAESADGDLNYKTVRDRALAVRQAIRARDQALADLPWYTQWLARQPLNRADEDELEALWAGVHDLGDQLEKPDYAKAAALAAGTDAVNAGLQKLRDRFRAACGDGQPRPILQRSFHELEDLLSVPFIESGLRTTLVRDARRISLALNVGTAKAAAAGDEPLQDSAARTKTLAFQQGRLAVAVLGKDSTDGKDAARLLPPFEQELWQADLDAAGDKVGRAFQNLARNADEAADKSRKTPPADAAAPLRQAALQTRWLDAGEADAWLKDVDPVDENRRVQMHDLLLRQAERTRLDYWASADPANPYYRAAGLVYAGDARDFAAGGADLKDEEKAARLAPAEHEIQMLKTPDAFAILRLDGDVWKADPEKLHITDEKTIPLQVALVGPKDAPPGRPVVWARPGPKLIAPPEAGQPRSLDRVADQPAESSVTYTLIPDHPIDPEPPAAAGSPLRIPPPPKEDSDFAAAGLFRGRAPVLDTPVRLHNRPDLVSYQPREQPIARIAVQASEKDFELFAARNSELVMVLDYSGSMTLPVDGKSSRKDKVLKAVDQCLMSLPAGVRLTVMTFGADSYYDIVVQRSGDPWKPAERGKLIQKLEGLNPKGRTPLVQAVARAAEQFTPAFRGQKSIVVLTDGGDDEFNREGSPSYKELHKGNADMKKVLHNLFDGSRVQVSVVGFRLGELETAVKDGKADQGELDGAVEFQKAVEAIGGTFTEADQAEDLAEKLKRFFLQVRFWVEKENGDPVDATAREGMHVSLDTDNARPSISVPAPANYHVLIEAFRNQDRTRYNLPDQHVHVEPGEVLVLDLKDAPDADSQFELRRDVYARSYVVQDLNQPVAPPLPAGQDWLLTMLGNRRVQNAETRDAREITASLERMDEHVPKNGTLRQSRPTLAWFSVSAEGDPQPVSGLRFYPLANYPAPVWRLSLAEWKPGAAPVVDAWWYEDALPEGVTLRQGREYTRPSELKGRSVEVRPTEADALAHVIVEGVSWEQRTVEVEPGKWARDMDCLVVRLRFPPGKKYFVQMPDDVMRTKGGQLAGDEHRFYIEANKYTGLFFGVGPDQVEKLAWLKLISVEAAHDKAVRVDGTAIRQDGTPPLPIEN